MYVSSLIIVLTEFVVDAMRLCARSLKSRQVIVTNLKNRSSSSVERFPKTLFTLSQYRITEDNSSGDLLSQSQMHIDDRDEVALVTQHWRR
jgi:hypothetical protein